MRYHISLLLFFSIILNYNSFSQKGWDLLNPSIPNSNLYSVHFPSENVGYAVGSCGMLLKTTDAGDTWTWINININKDITSVYFLNDTIGYISVLGENISGFSLVYRTFDGGNTWWPLDFMCNSFFSEGTVLNSVCAIGYDSIYVVGRGIHYYPPPSPVNNVPYSLINYTPDGGVSEDCGANQSGVENFVITFINDSTGYYGTNNGRVYKTSDGHNWYWHGTNLEIVNSISFPSLDTGYACGGAGIVKTNDSGETWVELFSATSFDLMSCFFTNNDTGIVVGKSDTIYITHDGGETWSFSLSGCNSYLNATYFTSDSIGYIVGNTNTILKTIDGGQIWQQYSYLSNETQNLNCVYFPSSGAGYITGNEGLVKKTIDLGMSWSTSYIQNNPNLYSAFFINDNYGYVAGDSGSIYQTTNSGNTWKDCSASVLNTIYSINFVSDSIGVAVGSGGIILRTTSPSLGWTVINSGTSNNLRHLCFPTPDTGYAVGDNGTFLKTVNGGADWQPSASIINGNWINLTSVKFINSECGYASGYYHDDYGDIGWGEVLATFDGGESFSSYLDIYESSKLNSVWFAYEPHKYSQTFVVGALGTIIKSDNSFNTLIPEYYGCNELKSIFFINQDTGFVVGDGGLILRTYIGTFLDISDPTIDNIHSNINVFPNPAHNVIYFSIETEKSSNLTLNIYDVLGNLIYRNSNYENSAGFSKISVDCSNYPNGIYFYLVTNTEIMHTGKFIKY